MFFFSLFSKFAQFNKPKYVEIQFHPYEEIRGSFWDMMIMMMTMIMIFKLFWVLFTSPSDMQDFFFTVK